MYQTRALTSPSRQARVKRVRKRYCASSARSSNTRLKVPARTVACIQGRRTRGGCGCFNTHTFPDERVQHPHFFCSFYAVLHKRLTAVAPRFLWPLCVWECARCGCLLSPPSQTWHRLWVWPADDWLFCLKSRLSWYVRFIGQLVLRRRELMVMVIYISLFQVLWMSVYAFEFFK